jgi:hypothetical protein
MPVLTFVSSQTKEPTEGLVSSLAPLCTRIADTLYCILQKRETPILCSSAAEEKAHDVSGPGLSKSGGKELKCPRILH